MQNNKTVNYSRHRPTCRHLRAERARAAHSHSVTTTTISNSADSTTSQTNGPMNSSSSIINNRDSIGRKVISNAIKILTIRITVSKSSSSSDLIIIEEAEAEEVVVVVEEEEVEIATTTSFFFFLFIDRDACIFTTTCMHSIIKKCDALQV